MDVGSIRFHHVILLTAPRNEAVSEGEANISYTFTPFAVPSGKVLRQGCGSPKVEIRFVWTHHAIAQPSQASWRFASASPVPFKGMLLTVMERPILLSPNGSPTPW
jgi:hypothetical protein